jgi:glutathione S-transferase
LKRDTLNFNILDDAVRSAQYDHIRELIRSVLILPPPERPFLPVDDCSIERCPMPNLTLYHASPSRSSVTLWMLEELGQPYDIHLLHLSKNEQAQPDYLAINPMGKVPALKHGDTVITEVAAICTYLADEFPDAKLNVPVGTPRRGVYLKWLFFGPSCMEPAVIDRASPRKEEARRGMLGYGDFDTTMNVVAAAVAKGPWIMGEQFTAADVVVGSQIRWGMMFKLIPERKEFLDYSARIAARPAAQRAEAKDKDMADK